MKIHPAATWLLILAAFLGGLTLGHYAAYPSAKAAVFQEAFDKVESALTFPPESGDVQILGGRVIDGDTFEFCWLVEGRARLHGVNAPEKGKPLAKQATDFLANYVENHIVNARIRGKEKFGRYLVEVYLDANMQHSLAALMIDRGLVKAWDGKGKRP